LDRRRWTRRRPLRPCPPRHVPSKEYRLARKVSRSTSPLLAVCFSTVLVFGSLDSESNGRPAADSEVICSGETPAILLISCDHLSDVPQWNAEKRSSDWSYECGSGIEPRAQACRRIGKSPQDHGPVILASCPSTTLNVLAGQPMDSTQRRELTMRPTSILDPRFCYVPSMCTDVAATWRRFGFNPQRDTERHGEVCTRLTTSDSPTSESPGLFHAKCTQDFNRNLPDRQDSR
jgi:hypothetical protein